MAKVPLHFLIPILSVALLNAGCSEDATQLVVWVGSDLSVPAELSAVNVSVRASAGSVDPAPAEHRFELFSPSDLPLSFSVGPPSADPEAAVTIVAEAVLGPDEPRFARRATTRMIRGKTLLLRMFLSRACQDRACGEGLTCTESGCDPEDLDPASLQEMEPGDEFDPWSARDAGGFATAIDAEPRAESDGGGQPEQDAGWPAVDDAGSESARDSSATDGATTNHDGSDGDAHLSSADGGALDGTAHGGADAGVFQDAGCLATLKPAARDRVVLVTQQFGSLPGAPRTEIRSLTLQNGGTLVDNGARLDVQTRPEKVAFVPSGEFALVAGNGHLVSVAVHSVTSMSITDNVLIPGEVADMRVSEDGESVFIVVEDSAPTAGVAVVNITCDGHLIPEPASMLPLRLARALALHPNTQDGVLLGGQVTFAPPDPNDLRWVTRVGPGWIQSGAFDLLADGDTFGGLALSPDGQTLLVPSTSGLAKPGGELVIVGVDVASQNLVEIHRVIGMSPLGQALFSPDGQTALVTQLQPGGVSVLTDSGSGWEVVDQILGIGLAEEMAIVRRGPLAGRVLLPSIDGGSGGPNIAMLQVIGPGLVTDLGQLGLGSGAEHIPDAIAIAE